MLAVQNNFTIIVVVFIRQIIRNILILTGQRLVTEISETAPPLHFACSLAIASDIGKSTMSSSSLLSRSAWGAVVGMPLKAFNGHFSCYFSK